MTWFRLLHFLGTVFWVGSVVAIALSAAKTDASSVTSYGALRRANMLVTTPSMLLSFVGGLGLLLPNFSTLYAKAGWMHTKLVLLIVLAGVTGMLSGRVRRASQGQAVKASGFDRLAIAGGVIGAVIVVLAVLQPGS